MRVFSVLRRFRLGPLLGFAFRAEGLGHFVPFARLGVIPHHATFPPAQVALRLSQDFHYDAFTIAKTMQMQLSFSTEEIANALCRCDGLDLPLGAIARILSCTLGLSHEEIARIFHDEYGLVTSVDQIILALHRPYGLDLSVEEVVNVLCSPSGLNLPLEVVDARLTAMVLHPTVCPGNETIVEKRPENAQ